MKRYTILKEKKGNRKWQLNSTEEQSVPRSTAADLSLPACLMTPWPAKTHPESH